MSASIPADRMAELRALVRCAFELAHYRDQLVDLDENQDEEEVKEQLAAAAEDAIDAMRGVGTCDDEPCAEWLAFVDGYRLALAQRSGGG